MNQVSLLFIITLILFACDKNEIEPTTFLKVATENVSKLTSNSAISGGSLEFEGELEIINKGVCWSVFDNPTIINSKTLEGSEIESFTSKMTDLTDQTTYYVRAYVITIDSTIYGNQRIFKTHEKPIITHSGDVVFRNQNQVDDFAKRGYTNIFGNLQIGYSDNSTNPIMSIAGLSTLISITGSLVIRNNPSLIHTVGLENLISIGEHLSIFENKFLVNVDGLNNLSSISGSLEVTSNPMIRDLDGLNIDSVGGDITITDNDKLTGIDGFNNLKSINGELKISFNNGLTSINGFSILSTINDNFEIERNYFLSKIQGFNSLVIVDGNFKIFENLRLAEMNGISQLATVNSNFILERSYVLKNIDNFSSLTKIGSLTMKDNGLNNLDGLSNLTSSGYLVITHNSELSDFCGIRSFVVNEGIIGTYLVEFNSYNPTERDIINGNCRK